MMVLCCNLHTGQISSISINNLRSINVSDVLTLQINPEYAFSDLLDMSRVKNVHGKYSNNEMRSQQENAENMDIRVTRSGTSYYSSCPSPPTHHTSGHSNLPKSILKVTDKIDKFLQCKCHPKVSEYARIAYGKGCRN